MYNGIYNFRLLLTDQEVGVLVGTLFSYYVKSPFKVTVSPISGAFDNEVQIRFPKGNLDGFRAALKSLYP